MAMTKSGLYVHTFQEHMRATALTTGTWDLRTSANFKVSLLDYTNTVDGSDPVDFSAADSSWTSTHEKTGTNWATGGLLLSVAGSGDSDVVPTAAESPAGTFKYTWTNPVVQDSVTVSDIGGIIVYNDATTLPADLADWMLVAIAFGATYSPSNGTLTLTPNASGIFYIDLTP